MSYIIDGPVTLGDTSTATTIKGNVSVPDTSSHTGDIFYTTNTSGAVAALQHVVAGVLLSDTSTSLPTWLPNGSAGQVLTANTGANPSWQTVTGTGTYGFSANYSNATAQTSVQSTTSTGTISQSGFVVTGAGTAFTTAMIGGKLVTTNGTFTVTGFVSSTNISVFPAATQTAGTTITLTWGVPVILTNWDTGTAPFYDGTSGGFVASTGIFTNPNAVGKYILDCQVTYTDSANDGYRVLQVLRNSTVAFQTIVQAQATTAIPRTITVSGSLKLATNDTIKIQFANNGGSIATAMASTAADATSCTHWSMVLQGTA